MMRATIICAVLALGATAAAAQDARHGQGRADLNVTWALPQGAFDDLVDEPAVGVTLLFGGRVPGLPLELGTELGLLNYGSTDALSLHGLDVAAGPLRADLPLEVVDVETSHDLLMGHLVARLQPADGVFQPYLEGVLGLRRFVSRTHVTGDFLLDADDDWLDDHRFDATAEVSDLALSYGVGGGLDLTFFRGPLGWEGREARVALNLGVRYLFGTEAEYLTEGSVRTSNGRFLFLPRESRTDLLMPLLGLKVKM